MQEFIEATQRVMQREWHRIAERKTLYMFAIIVPLALFFFLVSIYTNGLMRDIPVGVYDADHSQLSQLITESIEGASSFRIVEYEHSIDEIRDAYLKGRIQGAFYIPENLEHDLKRGKPASVVVFNNETNLVIGNTTLKDATTIIKTISGGVLLKKLRSKGMSSEQAMAVINPIHVSSQMLYNPNYNYLHYIGIGIIPAVLQMLIMVTAVLLITSEVAHNTMQELLTEAHGNLWAIVTGKSIPHLAVHAATTLGIFGIIFPFFHVDIIGSTVALIGMFFYFVIACFMMGFMISAVSPSQQIATEISFILNIPAFLFSGFVYPLWAMPWLHNLFAQLLPFTHFLPAFLKLYQMGAPIKDVLPEVLQLTMMIGISICVTMVALWYRFHWHESSSSVSSNDRSAQEGHTWL
ncbi:MAG TPA: ABC transporter permease [Bacteroidota bacterium]|nr:ABC transporter permease [Bacteroidota bacterium]